MKKWARNAYWRFGVWAGWTSDELGVAFDAGVQAQREFFDRRIADLKAHHARELRACAALAEQRGQIETLAIIENLIEATFPNARGGRPN